MSEPTEQEGRDIRADARDVRADARDVRADTSQTDLKDRALRSDVREDVVSEREGTVVSAIRLLRWLVIVLVVLSSGNFFRSFQNQDATEKAEAAAHVAEEASLRVESAATQGRDASLETLAELRAILAQLEETNANEPDLQNQAIIDALQAIARIEAFVCDGACPEVVP